VGLKYDERIEEELKPPAAAIAARGNLYSRRLEFPSALEDHLAVNVSAGTRRETQGRLAGSAVANLQRHRIISSPAPNASGATSRMPMATSKTTISLFSSVIVTPDLAERQASRR
jgi:hypothetical protein